MKKTTLLMALALAAFLCAPQGAALAKNCSACPKCPQAAKACGQACDKSGSSNKDESLKDKFFKKAHFYLQHAEELGLSDEQTAQIKSLKMSVKKDAITKTAEIEVIKLDVQEALKQDSLDTKAINGLIDKKYDLKKQQAKSVVDAYAKLKAILTAEQKSAAKDLWTKKSR